jgi:hypothetical protein
LEDGSGSFQEAFHDFVARALTLGCAEGDAQLWAQIAVQRGWQPGDLADFDDAVLDYLVRLGMGETWPQELRAHLESHDE